MIRKLSFFVAIALVVGACSSDTSDEAAPQAPQQGSSTTTTEPPPAPTAGQVATAAEDTEDHAEEDVEATAHGDATAHSENGADHDEEAGSEDVAADDTAGRAVEVSMTELAFTPDEFTVTAGEAVTFQVSNDGLVIHEFRLSNAHRIEEHITSGHEGHHGGGGHHDDADVVLELEPGETEEITVTFPEDATIFTEVACLIPGHYEGGMKAPVDYT